MLIEALFDLIVEWMFKTGDLLEVLCSVKGKNVVLFLPCNEAIFTSDPTDVLLNSSSK